MKVTWHQKIMLQISLDWITLVQRMKAKKKKTSPTLHAYSIVCPQAHKIALFISIPYKARTDEEETIVRMWRCSQAIHQLGHANREWLRTTALLTLQMSNFLFMSRMIITIISSKKWKERGNGIHIYIMCI